MGWLDKLLGGGDPTVTQTNKVQYSPEQQSLFNMAFPMAQQFGQQGITLPGTTVAGFNPNEIAGQNAALAAIPGGQGLAQQGAQSLNFMMNPNILSPDSNPYLAQQGAAMTDQFTDNLLQRVLPQLRGGFSSAGGPYSGGMSKEGIALGLGTGESMEGLSSGLANLYGNAYGQGLQTMLGAQGMLPQTQGAQLFGAQVQSGVGEQQRGMEQAQLDAANQASLLQQIMPLLQAQQLFGLGLAMPGAQQVNTATGATPGGPGILKGAAGGAMAGSTFGPVGTLIGGGLGGLLGAFG
jgi:hypothetical protein